MGKRNLVILGILVISSSLFFWTFFQGGIVYLLLTGQYELLQEQLFSITPLVAALVVIGLVIVEVVIGFIPGFIIYGVTGALFGVWVGSVLGIVGNFIGAIISYGIGAEVGDLFKQKKNSKWKKYLYEHGPMGLFFLRLNPLTSHDILVHVAGGIKMPFRRTMIANTLGIIPYVVISSVLGQTVTIFNKGTLVFLTVVAIIYFGVTIVRFQYTKRK